MYLTNQVQESIKNMNLSPMLLTFGATFLIKVLNFNMFATEQLSERRL